MKIRKKEKIAPIHLNPEDRIELFYQEPGQQERQVLAKDKIGREITINEAIIFDVEKGDFTEDVVNGIGGAFVSTKKQDKK